MTGRVRDSRTVAPPLPPRHTPRPRLTACLELATQRPLTVVSAGPGSGKTALLSEWSSAGERPVAWVSLDATLNEPVRFWPVVAAALRAAGVAPRTDQDELASNWAQVTEVDDLDAYFASVEPEDGRVVLILDDAHELTNTEIIAGLNALLRQRRSQLVMVLAARSDPVLPLHRHRLAGQLSEIRAEDLRMTREETAKVLAAHGVTLRGPSLDALCARTEGWVAGVRLCAMSMAGHPHPSELVTELAMDTGSVGEYLTQEVLSQLDAPARTLLLNTGFLGEITPDLAARVALVPDAGRILEDLAAANAFVIPVDREHTTYRYHQLLAEILRHLLHREPEAERATLVRRAVAWYVEQQRLDEALRTGLDAGDWTVVASVLADGGFLAAFVARTDLRRTQEVLVAHEPFDSTTALAHAAVTVRTAPARARAYLERVDRDEAVRHRSRAVTLSIVDLLLARAERRHDDVERLARDLLSWSDLEGMTDALRSAISLERAQSFYWNNRHGEVESVLLNARALARASQQAQLELECDSQLALASGFWGRLAASQTYEREATRLVRQSGQLSAPPALHLANALRCFIQADVVGADQAVRRAERARTDSIDQDLRLAIPAMRAMILVSSGQHAEALSILHALTAQGDRLLADYSTAQIADIEALLGRPATAVRLLTRSSTSRSNVASVSMARARLMLGELDRAEEALRPVLAMTIDPPSIRLVLIDALIVHAAIASARGLEERAVESLQRAISMANGEVLIPFAMAGGHFEPLLRRHRSLADTWPVMREGPARTTPPTSSPTAALHEPLTERESAILQWLATSMSTSEIAEELYVSVNTVKTHVAAIYRKLPAKGRRDAIRRARELELL